MNYIAITQIFPPPFSSTFLRKKRRNNHCFFFISTRELYDLGLNPVKKSEYLEGKVSSPDLGISAQLLYVQEVHFNEASHYIRMDKTFFAYSIYTWKLLTTYKKIFWQQVFATKTKIENFKA